MRTAGEVGGLQRQLLDGPIEPLEAGVIQPVQCQEDRHDSAYSPPTDLVERHDLSAIGEHLDPAVRSESEMLLHHCLCQTSRIAGHPDPSLLKDVGTDQSNYVLEG